MGSGASWKWLSRPERAQRTRPACSRTRRCLVMAWRVRLEPSESWAMERGWASESLVTRASRVSSPRAAKR